jgi:CRISPR-associated protein Cas1
MNVDSGKLRILNGLDRNRKEHQEIVYKPKFIDIDNIVMYGHTGNLSLSAIKWLMKHDIPISVIDWNGRLLTSMNPPQSKHSFVKMAQYKAYENGLRLDLAKKFIDAKLNRTEMVINWLNDKYPEIDSYLKLCDFRTMHKQLSQANKLKEIMGIEGIIAHHYFNGLKSIFPEKFEFETRGYGKTNRPLGAVDPINALFNYGYSVLESRCYKALNSSNLDCHVGFLHEMQYGGKAPMVYDLQEPYRWIVDIAVINGLENKVFAKNDFIRTESYVIRLKTKGIEKLMDLLNTQFAKTVKYKGKNWQWSSIIDLKAQELANYLLGKRKDIDFTTPSFKLDRIDNKELRDKILAISYTEWKELGYSKGSLHQLKEKAKSPKPFYLQKRVKEKLENV